MDRHDRPGFAGNGGFQLPGIEVISFGIDIHKYGLGLEAGNASSSGDEGKGLCDYFVAGIDIQCHQGKQQGVRARCTPQGELAAHKRGDFSLQFPHLGSHDKQLALQTFPTASWISAFISAYSALRSRKGKSNGEIFCSFGCALAVSDCISKFNYSDCDNFPRGHRGPSRRPLPRRPGFCGDVARQGPGRW